MLFSSTHNNRVFNRKHFLELVTAGFMLLTPFSYSAAPAYAQLHALTDDDQCESENDLSESDDHQITPEQAGEQLCHAVTQNENAVSQALYHGADPNYTAEPYRSRCYERLLKSWWYLNGQETLKRACVTIPAALLSTYMTHNPANVTLYTVIPSTCAWLYLPLCLVRWDMSKKIIKIRKTFHKDITNAMPPLLITALKTPICHATQISQQLLDAKADINSTDEYSNTALHYAVATNKQPLQALLIMAGADPYANNHYHITPASMHNASLPFIAEQYTRYRALKRDITHLKYLVHHKGPFKGNKDIARIVIAYYVPEVFTDADWALAYHLNNDSAFLHHSPSPQPCCQLTKDQ